MKTFTALLIVAAILNAGSLVQSQDTQQYCVPIRPVVQDGESQPDLPISQGPPGPPGLPGSTGMKGDRGNDGKCLCDLSDDKQLKLELFAMKRNLKKMEEILKKHYYYEYCGAGIADGRIPDSAMTASSSINEERNASKARLDSDTYWRPHDYPAEFIGDWLQVDMGTPTTIFGIVTQGTTPVPNTYSQYLKSYRIFYGNSTTALSAIKDPNTKNDLVFSGDEGRTSYKMNKFPQPITAKYFRLEAIVYVGFLSLRLEYLIC